MQVCVSLCKYAYMGKPMFLGTFPFEEQIESTSAVESLMLSWGERHLPNAAQEDLE